MHEKNISYFRSFLHTYSGSPFIEDLWDWIDEMEDYFEEMQSPERLKCRIASYTLEGAADCWWCQLEHHRFSWWRMKHLMAERFIHTQCSMKCPSARGFYNATSVVEMQATSEIAKHAEQIEKQRKSSLDEVSVRQQSKEPVEVKPAKCSTKVHNNEVGKKNSTVVYFDTDNTPKYGASTPASTFEEEFGCEQPPQLQHLATIVVQNILVAKGAHGNEGSAINYTVTSLEDTHVLVKGITTRGQEVEIELNTSVKIEALDDVSQDNNAYSVLMDAPKLDLPLKYDSPIHVLRINPSELETMMLKVLIKSSVEKYNSMVVIIGKESGGAGKVGNAKEEKSGTQLLNEPYFMNDGTLYLSFDPGGHGFNEAQQCRGSQAITRFVEICNLELGSSAATTSFEGNMRSWTVLHNPYSQDNLGSPYTYSLNQGDAVFSYLKRFPRNHYGRGLLMFLFDPGGVLSTNENFSNYFSLSFKTLDCIALRIDMATEILSFRSSSNFTRNGFGNGDCIHTMLKDKIAMRIVFCSFVCLGNPRDSLAYVIMVMSVMLVMLCGRISGRFLTDYYIGCLVNMGASWLHLVCNKNYLAHLLCRLGLFPHWATEGNLLLHDQDLEISALFSTDGHQAPQQIVIGSWRGEHADSIDVLLQDVLVVLDGHSELRHVGLVRVVCQWCLCGMKEVCISYIFDIFEELGSGENRWRWPIY